MNEMSTRLTGGMIEAMTKTMDYTWESMQNILGDIDANIATTPYETVYTEDRIKLNHYKPLNRKKNRLKTPLLIVYALINRETMLDIQPERSVIRNLINAGVDLYVLEWGYPSRKDRFLTIDDHVNGYIDNTVDFIRKSTGMPKINLMGICMGGTFSAIYAAQHPGKVKNLITTVTPTSFDTEDGLLHVWMRDINADRFTDAYGNIPGDIMNLGFLLLNPSRLIFDKYNSFFENMDDKKFVENFIKMEKWIFDSPDMPGETFRQFITDCYQKNLLIQNRMDVGGRTVNLKNITMPVLNIYAKYDHLVPPAACSSFTKATGSDDTEDICLDTGHIGIYVSSKSQSEFVPRITKWLKKRDTATALRKKAGVAASPSKTGTSYPLSAKNTPFNQPTAAVFR